jgi:hypothetical protein
MPSIPFSAPGVAGQEARIVRVRGPAIGRDATLNLSQIPWTVLGDYICRARTIVRHIPPLTVAVGILTNTTKTLCSAVVSYADLSEDGSCERDDTDE